MIISRPGMSRLSRAARTRCGSVEPALSIASASTSTAVKVPAAVSLIGWLKRSSYRSITRLAMALRPAISRDQAVPDSRASPSGPAPSTVDGPKPAPATRIPGGE